MPLLKDCIDGSVDAWCKYGSCQALVPIWSVRLEVRARNTRRRCGDRWEMVVCDPVRGEFVKRKRNHLGVVISPHLLDVWRHRSRSKCICQIGWLSLILFLLSSFWLPSLSKACFPQSRGPEGERGGKGELKGFGINKCLLEGAWMYSEENGSDRGLKGSEVPGSFLKG